MDEEEKDIKGMVQLLGLTEKEIIALINAEISITDDMIDRIVKNYGTSKELWKNGVEIKAVHTDFVILESRKLLFVPNLVILENWAKNL